MSVERCDLSTRAPGSSDTDHDDGVGGWHDTLPELHPRPDCVTYTVSDVAHDVHTVSASVPYRFWQSLIKLPAFGAEAPVDTSASPEYGEGVGI